MNPKSSYICGVTVGFVFMLLATLSFWIPKCFLC